MIQVHLIGYTADLRYLVLDVDADSERGRYRLPVDVDLFLTLDEVRELRRGEGMEAGPGPAPAEAEGTPDAPPAPAPPADDAVDEELFADREAADVAPAPAADVAPAPAAAAPFDAHVAASVKVISPPPSDDGSDEPPPETEPTTGPPDDTLAAVEEGAGERAEEVATEEPVEEPIEEREARPPSRPVARRADVPPGAPETDGRRTPRADRETEPAPRERTHAAAARRPAATADSGSALTPAQIQSLLRSGRSAKSVARAAGTDVTWVERWLPPILAERDQVLREARNQRLERSRLGRSRKPLGAAISASLAARNIDPDDVTWTASRRVDGRWSINIRFRHRGRSRSATWAFDREEGTLTAASPLARDLGWTGANSRGRGRRGPRRGSSGRQRRSSRS